ncbi:MAG: hypothetical protein FH748_06390 [Balneolaceae bacterium]|nr:hypothetical protein [Balneolaceae bacterium]
MLYLVLMILAWVIILSTIVTLAVKKQWKWLGGTILVIILVLNSSPVLPIYLGIDGLLTHYYYTTENHNFEFTEIRGKRDLEIMDRSFNDYLEENPGTQDTTIYRTFRFNPLKVWKWRDYLTHPRWDYPYMDYDRPPRQPGEVFN